MNKYRNQRVSLDGYNFASKAEARRYGELKLMLRAKEIWELVIHPQIPLVVCDVKIGTYVADFSYYNTHNGEKIIEDVKSPPTKTPVYRLKKKLLRALYGIEITEIMA